jgi:photosystem II stability/assembly factor-like uncharacterized protein
MAKTRRKTKETRSSAKKPVARGEMTVTAVVLEPGPRKKKKPGAPDPRLSNHKARCIWFQSRVTWPYREASTHAVVEQRRRAKASLTAISAQWDLAGPTNIGGRMTSIVCHPTNPDVIWAGAAGGGVWTSRDAGKTWTSLWHSQDVLNVGSLAIDSTNPDTIYCGTGEADLSSDSYAGVGIYQTSDGGKTWKLLADSNKTGIPTRIGAIAIDPFNPQHLRIGGVGQGETSPKKNDFGGMYVSRDSGLTWSREVFISNQNYWCHSIVFHPKQKDVIFATFTERGVKSGIWRSTDGGKTWTHLLKGLPDPARFGRTSLAISLSNPKVLYAFASDEASGQRDLLLGVFRSDSGGDLWKSVSGSHFKSEGQISYGNTIAIDPKDPKVVICGGVDLHLTKNGGKSWTKVTKWDAKRGSAHYAHADHHALLMPANAPGRIYSMNDGGMDVSEDTGASWSNRSNGLAATMYYDMDVAQSDGRSYGGGAQDNGTLVTTDGRSDDHFEILGGDGGWMVYDPQDAAHIYASFYNMGIYRFRGGTSSDVSPNAPDPERNSIWMCYITMDPSDSKRVYTGSTRVWCTTNDGTSWQPISPVLDGGAISAIEVAPADPNRIYVGTEHGGVFRSLDRGKTWSPDISGATMPGNMVTRLETTKKLGADVVLATVANSGHSHVFRSQNGGLTWSDIDKGQLPDVPHHAVLIKPDEPNVVFVANDAGVFSSLDHGMTWTNMSGNLPNVMVIDLVYQLKDKLLYAATYGRSIWKIKV